MFDLNTAPSFFFYKMWRSFILWYPWIVFFGSGIYEFYAQIIKLFDIMLDRMILNPVSYALLRRKIFPHRQKDTQGKET